MKTIVTKMLNSLYRTNNRLNSIEERISKVENRSGNNYLNPAETKNVELRLREMEDEVGGSNICLIGVPGKKSREGEQHISVTNVTQQPQTYQFKINQCILLTIVLNLGLELGRAQLGSPHVESLIGLVSDVSLDRRHLKAPAGIEVQEGSLIWGVI